MKLESYESAESKHIWKLVRTDDYADIPGEIVSADEDTGECCVAVKIADSIETKTLNLGPHGFVIIRRAR